MSSKQPWFGAAAPDHSAEYIADGFPSPPEYLGRRMETKAETAPKERRAAVIVHWVDATLDIAKNSEWGSLRLHDASAVLRVATPLPLAKVAGVLEEELCRSGCGPLIAAAGVLTPEYDPKERLRVAVQMAEAQAQKVDGAQRAADLLALEPPREALVLGYQDLAKGFVARGKLTQQELDNVTSKALCESRAFRQIELFGSAHSVFVLRDLEGNSVRAYLPAACSQQFPLLTCVEARLIAEALPAIEPGDSVCLRVLAFGRRWSGLGVV